MQIAIATSDGNNVDEHFGRTREFQIYEVTSETFNLVRVCRVEEPYSSGDQKHSFDKEKFGTIADKLKDCHKVFVTKIGKAPAQALKSLGIEPVEYKGKISHIEL